MKDSRIRNFRSARIVDGAGHGVTRYVFLPCAWTKFHFTFCHLHTQFLLTALESYENLLVGSIFPPSGKWEITHSAQTLFKNQLGIMMVRAQPFHAISRSSSQHIGGLQDTRLQSRHQHCFL